ncbi:hypothetical protein ACHAXT_010607 [Thalassiosira profunda]
MASDRQHRWAAEVDVYCDDELVEDYARFVPSHITSVEPEFNCNGERCTKHFTGEDWKSMGNALRESKLLKKLKLHGLTKEAVEELFGGNKDWPLLRSLDFCKGKFQHAGFKKILPLLKPLSTFDTLYIDGCSLGVASARLLADALDHTTISKLDLSGNAIKDEGLERILSSRNAKHLAELTLGKCKLTGHGFDLLAQFLRRDDNELKDLSVDICQERRSRDSEEEYRRQKVLVRAISKESKLEVVSFGNDEWELAEKAYLSHLLCDTSNVEAVCNSNHQLRSLTGGGNTYWGDTVPAALSMNRDRREKGATVPEVIRRKLRRFYFKGDFDVQYFNDKMDVVLMPFLFHLAQRAQKQSIWGDRKAKIDDINAIYRLLRNVHVSEMFSFPGPTRILLWEKDEEIKKLKAEIGELKRENEELRRAGSALPNKRAKS